MVSFKYQRAGTFAHYTIIIKGLYIANSQPDLNSLKKELVDIDPALYENKLTRKPASATTTRGSPRLADLQALASQQSLKLQSEYQAAIQQRREEEERRRALERQTSLAASIKIQQE